jgi:hypothetical protein
MKHRRPKLIEIQCVQKTPGTHPWDQIQSIGGINPDGDAWRITHEQAVAGIESGAYSFYAVVGTHTFEVVVGLARDGRRYLRTVADGEQPHKLLSLPDCNEP